MSEFIATAKVRVRSDITGFREDLRAQIKRSAGSLGSIPIPVRAELKSFRRTLEAELRAKPIVVPVIADFKGGQIATKVRTEAQQAADAAQSAGAEARRRAAAAEKASAAEAAAAAKQRVDAAIRATEAEARLTAALSRRLNVVRSVTTVESARAAIVKADIAAEQAQTAAIEAGNVARARQIQVLRDSLALQSANLPIARTAVTTFNQQVVAQDKLVESSRKLAAQQESVRKGALSSSLSFAGVRGATLAANAEFLIGAAAVAAFAKALGSAVELQTNLNVFRVTTKATSDQMEEAAFRARELGRDITLPAVGAGDAAEAFTNLAKAGLDVEESLAGARGVLQLATAAQIDNAKATELTASALNSFGLAGNQAIRVADLLTGSANESQGSIEDIGIALQQSSAAARQAGFSLEDTVASLTLLARNGIRGSDAGTSLRTALLRLISPTDKAQDAINKLGVRIRDAQGNVRPEIFADIAAAAADFTAAQRDATFAVIFGQDAFRTQAILGREGAAGLNAMRDATQKEGLAAELAGARTAGLAGQVEALKNNLDTLGSSLGQVAIPAIGKLVEDMSEAVGTAEDFAEAIRSVGDAIPDIPGGDLLGDIAGGPRALLQDRLITARDEGSALIKVLKGGNVDFFSRPTAQLQELREGFTDSIDDANDLFETLDRISRGAPVGGGLPGQFLGNDPETVKQAVLELKKGVTGTSQEAEELRNQLDGVIRVIVALGRTPTQVELQAFFEKGFIESELDKIQAQIEKFPFGIPIEIDKAQAVKAAQDTATTTAEAFLLSFGNIITPGIANIFSTATASASATASSSLTKERTPAQILSSLSVFDARIVRAQIAKDVQAEIQALRDQQDFIRAQLAGLDPSQKSLKKKLESALLGSQNDLQSVFDGIASEARDRASDAKKAADDAKKAREDAHQATIDGFDLRVSRQQNVIELKAATAWLGDDLAALKGLRRILRQIIASGKLEADELAEFTSQLIQVDADIKAKNKEIRDRRKERRDRLIESAELDVDIANANKNIRGEIAARKRLINLLQAAQKAAGRNSLEWKRLQLKIAQERAAINELTAEQKEKKNAFRELTFEFLTTQQGFAANLFGNLIPLSATGGLVGNASPPPNVPGGGSGGPGPVRASTLAEDVEQEASVRAATGRGTSRGQSSTLIEINRQILRVLQVLARGQGFPEARTQATRLGGSMDIQ